MASYVSSQGVGESLFCPSKGENARVRRGERRLTSIGFLTLSADTCPRAAFLPFSTFLFLLRFLLVPH